MTSGRATEVVGVVGHRSLGPSPRSEPAARVRVERIEGFGPHRIDAEQRLTERGIVLPVPQRADGQLCAGCSDTTLLVAREADGPPIGALSAAVSMSRALPGHRIYRVERLAALNRDVRDQLIDALATVAATDRMCLRVVVETFEADLDARDQLAASLMRAGFRRFLPSRTYRHTLALDLRPSLDTVFSGLHATTRRHVRGAAKRGLELRAITDGALVPQVRALAVEAMRRTGANAESTPWERIVALSARSPGVSRVVGLFDPRASSTSSLVAFAWGLAHGPYASYEAAGSRRGGDLGSTPLGYAPMWDLMSWAREQTGASWFDLGGVSPVPANQLAGVVRFKRFFSDNLVEVGQEWRLEPHAVRAAIAHAVSKTAVWAGSGPFRRFSSVDK